MAEIELRILARHCLDRRIADTPSSHTKSTPTKSSAMQNGSPLIGASLLVMRDRNCPGFTPHLYCDELLPTQRLQTHDAGFPSSLTGWSG